jgi:hypothetical protein
MRLRELSTGSAPPSLAQRSLAPFVALVTLVLVASGCGGGATAQAPLVAPPVLPPAAPPAATLPPGLPGVIGPDPQAAGQSQVAYGSGLFRVTQAGQDYVILVPGGAGFDATRGGVDIDPATVLVLSESLAGVLYSAEGAGADGAPLVVGLYRHLDTGIACPEGACAGPSIAFLHPQDGAPGQLQVFGPPAGDLPMGVHSYRGMHLLSVVADGRLQQGDFVMTVDFDRARASLVAQTPDFGVSGEGIVVDLSAGRLSGGALEIRGPGGASVQARLQGTFHGSGATGVTALYHEVAPSPRLAGALAGSR